MEGQEACTQVADSLSVGRYAVDGVPGDGHPAGWVDAAAVKVEKLWTCLCKLLYPAGQGIPKMRPKRLIELVDHCFRVGGYRPQDAAMRGAHWRGAQLAVLAVTVC